MALERITCTKRSSPGEEEEEGAALDEPIHHRATDGTRGTLMLLDICRKDRRKADTEAGTAEAHWEEDKPCFEEVREAAAMSVGRENCKARWNLLHLLLHWH